MEREQQTADSISKVTCLAPRPHPQRLITSSGRAAPAGGDWVGQGATEHERRLRERERHCG
eukprot:724936-Hanusia_phi.AAC.2